MGAALSLALCCSPRPLRQEQADDRRDIDRVEAPSPGDEAAAQPAETEPPQEAPLEEAEEAPAASLTPGERIRAAARELIDQGDPTLWGRGGQLTPSELSNPLLTLGLGGLEAFNVLDSEGYEGDYKCNLFAFELAFRAGLIVPVVGRGRGWGYPGPAVVVDHVERGRLIERWARRLESTELEAIQALTEAGAALMIVGDRDDGSPGHIGVVDEVHRVVHDRAGRIARVEYTGWEANRDGAHHRRRVWRLGLYSVIHLFALRAPGPGEVRVVRLGFGPMQASRQDLRRHLPEMRTIGRGRDSVLPGRGRGLPELPVAHALLDGESAWGRIVDVRQVSRPRRDPTEGVDSLSALVAHGLIEQRSRPGAVGLGPPSGGGAAEGRRGHPLVVDQDRSGHPE